MTNTKQAMRRIKDLVETKGAIMAPGRFDSHILNEVGIGNRATAQERANVKSAITKLEESGQIKVHRTGEVITGIERATTRELVVRGPELRRQRLHATSAEGRQYPSHLTDDMCSPVTVRYVDKSGSASAAALTDAADTAVVPTREEEDNVIHIDYKMGEDAHLTLTAALQALRAEADETGQADLSVQMVLECAGLTTSQAGRVLDMLRALGLYTTEKTGFQQSTYTVLLEPAVVTPEMVKQARAVVNAPKKRPDTTPDAEADQPVIDEVKSTADEVLDQPVVDDTALPSAQETIDRLVGIIERIEQDLETERTQRNQLEQQLEDERATRFNLEGRLTGAEADLIGLRQENESLRQRLQSQSVPPHVSEILSRYSS